MIDLGEAQRRLGDDRDLALDPRVDDEGLAADAGHLLDEVAAAGACLITDAWEGIEMFLEPGKEVLVAADGEAVTAYLAALDPAQARAIGEAAHRRILAEHTYQHRASQVQKILDVESQGQTRQNRQKMTL